jgi:hypothetical protein
MTRDKTLKNANCARLEPDVILFHYGELSDGESQRVASHIQECGACSQYLEELAHFLPKTVLTDDPPPQFWQDYSRELRLKLAAVHERGTLRQRFWSWFGPWSVPALATSAIVLLALTFTLGQGVWRKPERPPLDDAFLEALPVAENLEFYENLDVLDAMDLLELMGDGAA